MVLYESTWRDSVLTVVQWQSGWNRWKGRRERRRPRTLQIWSPLVWSTEGQIEMEKYKSSKVTRGLLTASHLTWNPLVPLMWGHNSLCENSMLLVTQLKCLPNIYPSIYLSIHPSINSSIHLSIHLFIHQSIHKQPCLWLGLKDVLRRLIMCVCACACFWHRCSGGELWDLSDER